MYQHVASPRRWTELAIECYQRGCNCRNCYYQEFFKKSRNNQKCCMKQTVMRLMTEIGKPENIIEPTIIEESNICQKVG